MKQENVESVYELSPVQQGMLFHSLYAPDSGVYVVQVRVRLAGSLDVESFAEAWQRVVDRHPALRTSFYWEELQKPVQAVFRQLDVSLERRSWRGLTAAEQRDRLRTYLGEERNRGFELDQPPLMRLALCDLGDGAFYFIWSFHHLILDGWSQALVLREVFACYQALVERRPPALPRPRPYRHYIAWLQQQSLGAAETYWRRRLAGLSAPTLLAGPDTAEPSDYHHQQEAKLVLTADASSELEALARRHGLTLNTPIQGAWARLLAHHCGRDEVLFGTTVAGRPPELAGVEGIAGLFINTLPARVAVPPGERLLPWLQRLQGEQAELRSYEHSPLDQVRRWSGVAAGQPLFDHILVVESYPVDSSLKDSVPGLEISAGQSLDQTNYPLTLLVRPGPQLELVMDYDARRFAASEIRRWLDRWQRLLAGFAADPQRRVAEYPLVSAGERQQILREWNVTAADYPHDRCLHELIAEQVERTPEAPAVLFEGAGLTYRELDRRAAQVAASLRRRGVGPEVLVGVLMERSPELVVALIGILKAGGAYLPLEPSYPRERLAFMLADAGYRAGRAPVVLTRERWRDRVPAGSARIVCLGPRGIAGEAPDPAPEPASRVAPDNLAYVIHTSGSTGKPKGVQISHRGVVNFLHSMRRAPGLGEDDVLLAVTTICFDISVLEIFLPLIVGARVVMASRETASDGAALGRTLAAHGVTAMQATPTTWRLLVETGWQGREGMKMLCGGEALPPELAPRLVELGAELWNMYGPTETTIWSATGRVRSGPGPITLGGPIDNTRIHVLDRRLEPVPAGVVGEVYVGGTGLARGYLHRPGLTAERFLPDPLAEAEADGAGGRLYRVGDLARYRSDGELEFLGRVDHQVKVRGFRIELGEIEAVLGRRPGVREAAVVARGDETTGDQRLVAWVAAEEAPTVAAVQDFVRRTLPDYMVPSAVVFVDALPRLPNGKLDRKALARRPLAAAASRERLATAFVAPRNATEETLAAIWAEVLGCPRVGAEDSFFELGGDSILSIRVVSRAREAGLPLTPRDVFRYPRLGLLAAAAAPAAEAEEQMVTGPAVDLDPDLYPLAPLQQGLLFHALYEPQSGEYFEQLSCRMEGELDVAALRRAGQWAVDRHAILRTSFVWEDLEVPAQKVHRGVALPWHEQDWRLLAPARQAEELEAFLAADRRRGFDLSQPPLLRVTLIRIADNAFYFVFSFHHLLLDGWSLTRVLQEVFSHYGGREEWETPRPYRDYVAFLAARDQTAAETFWRRTLEGFHTATPLTTAPARVTGGDDYREHRLTLPRALRDALQSAAVRREVTVNTLVQAAWALLVGRYCGAEDVLFGTTVSGRPAELAGVESMVGLFINTLPVRVRVSPHALLTPWLRELQLRQAELRHYQYSPLEEVQKSSDLPSGQALFDHILVFENYPREASLDEHPAGLEISAVRAFERTNYALTVVLQPGAELVLRLLYDRRRYDPTAVVRIGAHFRNLLRGLTADRPPQRLAEVPILGAVERHHLLCEWNDTGAEVPLASFVPELFAAQAERCPDALAVVCEGPGGVAEQITYRQLNHRADRLAGELIRLGVGPEAVVGVCRESSPEMIVALLAVLKAGGAYLPLDPACPPQRLEFMLEDAAASVLLTQPDRTFGSPSMRVLTDPSPPGPLSPRTGLQVTVRSSPGGEGELRDGRSDPDLSPGPDLAGATCTGRAAARAPTALRRRSDRLAAVSTSVHNVAPSSSPSPPGDALTITSRPVRGERGPGGEGSGGRAGICEWGDGRRVRARQLAYVIYTSGSTGRPKGVAVTHGGLRNLVAWHQRVYRLRPGDRATQIANPAFDASVWEIWPHLTAGATIVVPAPEIRSSPAALVSWLARQRIDLTFVPTPVTELALGQPWPAGLALRALLTGGDRLRRRPGPELDGILINHYGPTENTVVATCGRVAPEGRDLPDVGRPIANNRVYLLERSQRPVPLGAPGELCVGGRSVARGYLRRPALTAEQFVPDPFAARPGGRLYRTGDLARYRADGTIDFLGRIDHQVKIRGFRLELGEIEAVLGRHPGVREAAVVVAGEADQRLVAYVATAPGTTAAALRAFLGDELPDYMVPAVFVELDQLPLTPNGKVDRAALGRLPLPGADGEGAKAPPRTPVEELLATIWAEVLDRDEVGRDEDFFELGGHSLLATQLVSRVRKSLGLDLPLRAVFDSPTVAGMAAALPRAGTVEAPPLVPVPRDRPLPASFAQQRLWFLDRLVPGSPFYNIPFALRLTGPLDVAALVAALDEIVRRHETLRTTFDEVEGGAVQIISPPIARELPLADLEAVRPAARQAEVRRLAAGEAARPFDLTTGPLFRVALLRLATGPLIPPRSPLMTRGDAPAHPQGGPEPGEHVLLLTQHHVVSDGWSVGVLFRELGVLYQAFSREAGGVGGIAGGRALPLPELPVQYADFAVWQRQWLRDEVLEAQLAWWKELLGDHPTSLQLPTDRPRPAVQTFRGGTLPLSFPAALSERLRGLSREAEATLAMTLLAGFHALLYRLTGEPRIIVGSPVAGRTRDEIEGVIGFFVNPLPMVADLTGEPGFREHLRRVREMALGAYAHQDLPFEMLVDALDLERDMSRNPLFQVVFALQNAPLKPVRLTDLTAELLTSDFQSTRFDLELHLWETPAGLQGVCTWDADLFDATTIGRLSGNYRILLERIAGAPDTPLAELPWFAAAERHQLLVEWNVTAGRWPAEPAAVHQLVAAQAAHRPQATAVVAGDQRLSYGQLEAGANHLAHRLRRLGVKPETPVAVVMPGSPQMIVALLAVLKAGAAYVPLDPDYPPQRLEFMLADAGTPVLLTRPELSPRFADAERRGVRVLAVGSGPMAGGPPPTVAVTRDQVAYVIYTSGSTGRPKGVAVTHGNLRNLLAWHQGHFQLRPDDRATQVAGPAFDASVWEIWPCLAAGATLCIPDPEIRSFPPALVRWLARERLTMAFLPTPVAEAALGEPWPPGMALRALTIGGDRLRRRPEPGLGWGVTNVYGPAENTVATTTATVAPEGGLPDVGRALANVRIYLVDRALRPVALGAVGELCAAGRNVARGYLGQPALTAERFVPDPFAAEAGGRLYRTGDLARYRADGTIDCLGRLDHQVKIRGLRLELGEIEAVLGRHPGVREAAVLVHGEADQRPFDPPSIPPYDKGGRPLPSQRLVAYVATAPGTTVAALRTLLRDSLPEYMVPAAFVELDQLPLTANDKVDRAALGRLPVPEEKRAGRTEDWVAPRTPTEELVAGIWSQILGVERVGAEDDFFDLGGHSLLATQVVSRIRRTLRVELPLRVLFEEPTVAGLAAWVTAARRELAAPPLRPAPRDGRLPLSFAQQRLWFLDRFEPGAPLYNVPTVLRLSGRLDPAALDCALNEIVRRHEVLRTTFAEVAGVPVQVIRPALRLPLPVIDLTRLADPQPAAEGRRLLLAEALSAFDLARGPLLRMRLLRLGAAEHALLVTVHHVAFDGWSIGVLLRELRALYQAFAAGHPTPGALLPELPVQYADFARWQRQWLSGEVLEAELAHWRRELAGMPVLELPTDRPRPAVQSYPGDNTARAFPAELRERLHELSRGHGTTLYMTLLAAFQALLGRYSGQRLLAVGSPIANRNRAEIEDLVGFFVNTLVLRGDLAGDPTFAALLARTRDVTLDAYAHQDLPFEQLVAELEPERNLSHNPLVQVLFVLQNVPMAISELAPGLAAELLGIATPVAQFDLSLTVSEEAEKLWAAVNYNTDLFDPTTIRRLLRHLENLLAGAVADPHKRLGELPLLAEAERGQLLREWNDTREATGGERLVAELIEAQTAVRPEAIAVVAADQVVSFADLNRRANRLAHHLRTLGVGPEVPVGLMLERTVEMVVAVVAVLKSGGAFVPLDPSYPEERLAFMAEDAGLSLLVTEERLRRRAPGTAPTIVCVDGDGASPGRQSEANPPIPLISPQSLAYVIHTSGSTGRPKGVAVTHEALAGHCRTIRRQLGLGPADRVLHSASFSFDVALEQALPALLGGARLVLTGPDLWLPSELSDRLGELAITVADLPAGYWQRWVEESADAPSAGGTLRLVSVGGDVMPPAAACRWPRTPLASARLVNAYGPTEATITATSFPVPATRPELACRHRVPIGRPLAGRALYVLDRFRVPAPIGVPGELCLGGAHLARGYLRRPALTAERFVPDPFATESGQRLYRTGDLARRRPDGNVEFLGRIDHQVKVRGFRIELGEIEAVLAGHPGVREAVVLARDAGRSPGDTDLVACLVADSALGDLRPFLERRLPPFMVPAAFVFLDALPRLPGGKVDRAALARPGLPEAVLGKAEYVAPRNPTEELMVGIWEEVLGLPGRPAGSAGVSPAPLGAQASRLPRWERRRERIGIDDNFFDRGGHSLLATQLTSRIRDTFRIELPLRALFETPTAAGLARRVEAALAAGDQDAPPPITAGPRVGEGMPLSFAQQRLWFLDRLVPGSSFYNVPFSLRLRGPLRVPALAAALDEIVRRHEVLRTTFDEVGADGPVQIIHPPTRRRIPLADLRALRPAGREREARRLAREEAERPFNLTTGPLLRTALLQLDAGGPEGGDHVLLLTQHHIVSDGWSIGVFGRELTALYGAFTDKAGGRALPLPELPIQYADFAVWQRQWLSGEALAAQLAWWQEQLGDDPPPLQLPTDRPRPEIQTFRGGILPATLPALSLGTLSREAGATVAMTLLAAFYSLLFRITGEPKIVVGSPVAGRTRSELEDLIGFFVNSLPMPGDLGGDPTFRELVGRVREMALGAYAHQGLPLEKLVEERGAERDLSRNPLFQVMFAVQNAPLEPLELPDLTLEPLASGFQSTRFDLEVHFQEGADGLAGFCSYDRDLFDATTIGRLMAHYRILLAAAVEDPERRLTELGWISRAERHQLTEWNDTATAGESLRRSLGELFSAQAARTPEAVAVEYGDVVLTYAELEARGRRLAGRLRALGVGPDRLVGLYLDRSPEMVVATVGIILAGGAYLPLELDLPAERLAFMLKDAGAVAVVAGAELGLPETDLPVLLLPVPAPVPAPVPDSRPPVSPSRPGSGTGAGTGRREVDGGNLGYVIYTSGSTGVPKGVAVPQSAVARLVLETDYVRLGPGDGVVQAASAAFDAATFEIWGPLLTGGRIVGVSKDLSLSPAALVAELEKRRARTLFLTTALFNQVVREIPQGFRHLREVLFGGEAVDPQRVRQCLAAAPPERLLHVYGPTESTTFATWHPVVEAARGVPIGRPLANTTAWVVDPELAPLPIGVPGELVLGGDGLARGYHRRPGLTAERFVPAPGGARLYRTGDLVRFLADGAVDFLGRIDHQVKIRGFRIEPGEIEAALLAQPGVREAVVVTREEAGDRRLVAYLAADGGEELLPDLRAALSRQLPAYMVPSAFVVLERLPLNPSGKVDRNVLARRPPARPQEAESRPPEHPLEELLAGIWAEVLGVEGVGRDEDFFALGGHSLLAARVSSRVRDTLRVELPVQKVFTAPTIAELAAEIEVLRREGRGIEAPPISPLPRDGRPWPLSFSQQRLWFLDRLEPGSSAYNVFVATRLEGDPDPAALERTFAELIRRHESLRTRFEMADGEPVQVVVRPPQTPLRQVDLRAVAPAVRERQMQRVAEEEAARPFDLGRAPLVRIVLIRAEADACVLLLTVHHVVADGWSLDRMIGEMTALYEAFGAGRRCPLPPQRFQYADFAVWQRQRLTGEVLGVELDYWRRRLGPTHPVLELPADRPPPPLRSDRGASLVSFLPPALCAELAAMERRRGMTRFMSLLAVLQALLHRYTGQQAIRIGTPVAGRHPLETESIVGLFLNVLVLHTDFAGDPGFEELMDRVREVTLGAYAHQELPFEKLVEELSPQRDLRYSPLYRVMLNFLKFDLSSPAAQGPAPAAELVAPRAKLDLTLHAAERDGGVLIHWVYSTDLFDRVRIARMAAHFENLLRAGLARPGEPISGLPLLSPAEAHQTRVEWNDSAVAEPANPLVHRLFEAQVSRTPDAVAVVWEGRSVTYRELDLRAGVLAARLRRRGVGPGAVVGIEAEPSEERVVMLLAVLKAGAACLPLDPDQPAERRSRMAADAGASLVLTREELADRPQADRETPGEVSADHPALVLYTSGSTGRPKGVIIPHRLICSRLLWMRSLFGVTAADRVLHKAAFGFDVAWWEILLPLLCGGQVIVARRGAQLDAPYLAATINTCRVTVVHFVPSVLKVLLETSELAACSGLRLVLSGGESLPVPVRERFFALMGSRLYNQYGTTETSIDVSFHPCEPGRDPVRVPVGRPYGNTRLHLLDRRGRAVPIGVVGEVCVGGESSAWGYLRQPALTAQRFVPAPNLDTLDPPSIPPWDKGGRPRPSPPGARLYRSGDLGCWRSDGRLEILGRIDHQVKIRGARIEPAEVESRLGEHPAVGAAAVVSRADAAGDQQLVAYLEGRGESPPSPKELGAWLGRRLPDSMVPSLFTWLEALPRTASGKVDRRALPAPETAAWVGERTLPARNSVELRLARIWEEVLGRPVGLSDDFFDLGGHSLMAVRLLAGVRARFGRALPLVTLFQRPTVERMAELLVRGDEPAAAWSPLVEIRRARSEQRPLIPPRSPLMTRGDAPAHPKSPFFCVHPIGGGVLGYAVLARRLGGDQPFYGLQARGLEGEGEPLTRIEEMAACYLEAVRGTQPEGPYFLGGWSMGGLVAFEMARRLQQEGEAVALLAVIDVHTTALPSPAQPDVALLAAVLGEWVPLPVNDQAVEELRDLTPDQQLDLVVRWAREAGILPPGYGVAEAQRLLALYKVNRAARRAYTPRPYRGRIDLFRAREQPPGAPPDPAMGWGRVADRVEIHFVPGNHQSIVREPDVQALAQELGACLSGAQQ